MSEAPPDELARDIALLRQLDRGTFLASIIRGDVDSDDTAVFYRSRADHHTHGLCTLGTLRCLARVALKLSNILYPEETPMSSYDHWPQYVSHKVVRAMPITGFSPDGLILVGARHEPFEPSEAGMRNHAEVGGYAVVYADGFRSVSPKKAFEDGYTMQNVMGADAQPAPGFVDQHLLQLHLAVNAEPEEMIAAKQVHSLDQVIAYVTEFIQKFGAPDSGPQTITVNIGSSRHPTQ